MLFDVRLKMLTDIALHLDIVDGEDDVFLVFEEGSNLRFLGIFAGFIGTAVGFAIPKRFSGGAVSVSAHVSDVGVRASALDDASDGYQERSGSTADPVSFSENATTQSIYQGLRIRIDEQFSIWWGVAESSEDARSFWNVVVTKGCNSA